jgi:hypothetical protein
VANELNLSVTVCHDNRNSSELISRARRNLGTKKGNKFI